jgi:Alginate export
MRRASNMRKAKWFVLLGLAAMVFTPALADKWNEWEEDPDGDFFAHGEVRFRGEYVNNLHDFDSNAKDSFDNDDEFEYFPMRIRAGLGYHFFDKVTVYAEFQYATLAGVNGVLGSQERDVLFSNLDNIDLYQGWVRVEDVWGSWDWTFGRQEFVYGWQFMFGNLDFYNGISMDGVKGRWNIGEGDQNLDLFWTRLSEDLQFDMETDLLTAYYNNQEWVEGGDVGFYLTYLRENANVQGSSGAFNERVALYSLGARFGRMYGGVPIYGWDIEGEDESGLIWNAELVYQTGELTTTDSALMLQNLDISAYGGEGMIGWNFNNGDHNNTVWARGYYASGDDDQEDDKIKTFQTGFQDFHNRNGRADVFHPENLTSIAVGWGSQGPRQSILVEFFQFWLSEDKCGDTSFFGPTCSFEAGHGGSVPVLPILGGVPGRVDEPWTYDEDDSEKDLGQELDVVYNFNQNQYFTYEVGMAYVFPGKALEVSDNKSGNPDSSQDDAVRLWAQVRVRF